MTILPGCREVVQRQRSEIQRESYLVGNRGGEQAVSTVKLIWTCRNKTLSVITFMDTSYWPEMYKIIPSHCCLVLRFSYKLQIYLRAP